MEGKLDPVDRQLLTSLQKDLPLVPRPFFHLGQLLGLPEEEVLRRVSNLKEKGIIRRLGGIFNSRGLGFSSTLVALRVVPEELEKVAARVNHYPGVTHNYARPHPFNLWFTLIGRRQDEVKAILAEIRQFEGVLDILVLPAKRIFKIGVKLDLVKPSEDS
ncbi:MAG: AsnC family transcriptional regulator [Firmicutes bacterium]|nr:AsnC family transcriptional regulator [Bacillota bacterium]MCL5039940.1 AsnC family transcriptional regulator [Bacillota bacterium]